MRNLSDVFAYSHPKAACGRGLGERMEVVCK